MKGKILITTLVLLCVSAGLAAAGSREKKGSERDILFFNRLNLTPEQMDKVHDLRSAYMKNKDPIRDRLYSKRM